MPATAGKVRMPANNRVHSSVVLQTNDIWRLAIGYDPYKPNSSNSIPPKDAENTYAISQGILQLARITGGSNADEARGACKRCGSVGHLTFQCRNYLTTVKDKADVSCELGKHVVNKSDGEEEDEGSEESSDSDVYDSRMERIIAQRFGKSSGVRKEKLKKKNKEKEDVIDGSDTDSGKERTKKKRESTRSMKRRRTKTKHDDDPKTIGRKGEERRKGEREMRMVNVDVVASK